MKDVISAENLNQRLYVRPKEVAVLCGISETIVYRALYSGDLRGQKFRGKSWLIKRDDAYEWVERHSEPNVA